MTLIEIWLRTNDRAKEIGVILEEQIKKELPPSVIAEASSVLKVKHKRHIDSINVNFHINIDELNDKRCSKTHSSLHKANIAQQLILILYIYSFFHNINIVVRSLQIENSKKKTLLNQPHQSSMDLILLCLLISCLICFLLISVLSYLISTRLVNKMSNLDTFYSSRTFFLFANGV